MTSGSPKVKTSPLSAGDFCDCSRASGRVLQGSRQGFRSSLTALNLTETRFTVQTTSAQNFASRSKIKNLCGWSHLQVSRDCSAIHKAFG